MNWKNKKVLVTSGAGFLGTFFMDEKMHEYMACGKPVIATKLPGVMKEFGEGNGVIYVDKPEDALKKAVELIESESAKEEGRKARGFVAKYNWDDIVGEFEGVLEEVI